LSQYFTNSQEPEPEPLGKKTGAGAGVRAGARAAWEKETLEYLIITALCLYIMHSALVQMKVLPVPIIVSSHFRFDRE
jgi:hypothetical protein